MLVLLPPGERRLEFAEPMGTPAILSTRIAELLPGTTFDADRRGTFRRGGYEITFDFVAERTAIAQATAIEVTVGSGEGFTALKRIVDKTGWQAVDPATVNPVDLDRSRMTGALALVSAASAAQSSKPRRNPPSIRTIAIAAAAGVVVIACASLVWQWSRSSGIFSTRRRLLASELAAGPPPYAHLPMLPKGAESSEARRAAVPQFVLAAEEVRGRFERLRELAPEFRGDEIVHQLIQFREASIAFPAKIGENGFMAPDRLSDAAFFAQLHASPRLPGWFADPQRDGYVFEFTGDDCTWRAHMVELGTLCFGFVYSARPLDASGGRRSYALFSADQRIHYRTGSGVPAQTDPIVDGDAASGGDPATGPDQPALQEAYALRDLRHAASAESLVVAIIGRGYVNPERLAEDATYLNMKIPSLVPSHFMQSVRQGYKFEFAGTNPLRAPTPFGGAYESFVYSATPQELGGGRRRLALYPGGRIYATTDRRLPTPQDSLVLATETPRRK